MSVEIIKANNSYSEAQYSDKKVFVFEVEEAERRDYEEEQSENEDVSQPLITEFEKEEIEKRGGKVTGSVTSKTNYLINNDTGSGTAKNKKARELGIPIISEEDFLQMMNE